MTNCFSVFYKNGDFSETFNLSVSFQFSVQFRVKSCQNRGYIRIPVVYKLSNGNGRQPDYLIKAFKLK